MIYFNKNSFLLRVSVIFVIVMSAVIFYRTLPVSAHESEVVTEAPLNPYFLDYLYEKQISGVQEQTEDGNTLGYIPSPLDLSHLTGLPLSQEPHVFVTPSTYDLRTMGKLTPVRNQANCGSCWSFATYGSLESILLPAETWDFSENNLKNTHGFDWGYCDGGNAYISTAYLARWSGPIRETDDPYNPNSGSSPGGLSPQKHMQEILIIPDRASQSDNENIKQMVMTYGALYTSMYYSGSYYNSTNYAYYFNGFNYSNHAVAIVGWDDYFDRNKFSTVPSGDGAFIIKNSWGTWWGENGYFYISYYDSNIGTENFVFNGAESVTNYSRIYQYDPLGWTGSVGYSANTAWFANIFTASASEQLSAVSFYAASLNSSYEIYVYTNATSGPISGTLAGSKTGTLSAPGYYTISLNSPITLTSGQKFSVVVKLTTPGYNYPIPMEYPYSNYSSQATASAGQSYISKYGSSWSDITSSYQNTNVCLKAFAGGGGPSGFSASGQVTTSGGAGISAVTMTFSIVSGSGTLPASVQTDSNGNWSQTGFQSGTTYRVTPTKNSYTFSPAYRDFSSESTGLNFTGTVTTTGITVTTPDGGENWQVGTTQTIRWTYSGSPGLYVKIQLLKGGMLNRTITKSTSIGSGGNGSYNWLIPLTQTPGTNYRIKVTSTTNSSYTDTSNNDFTISSSAGSYSISGRVTTSTGTGISGVTMTLSGSASNTTTTDSNGNYSFTGLANGSYTITPSKSGCTFTPTSRNVPISGADVTGQNFIGRCR